MIIGFSGKKGSGKTTAAIIALSTLGETLGDNIKYVNFKDALIKEMKERLPETLTLMESLYGESIDVLFKTKPPVVRALMRDYGTSVRRADNPDYWTTKWLEATAFAQNVLVDDVRFINEAETVRHQGGFIIRITRDGEDTLDSHQSEAEMDKIPCDVVIKNNGTMDELSQAVKDAISTFIVK